MSQMKLPEIQTFKLETQPQKEEIRAALPEAPKAPEPTATPEPEKIVAHATVVSDVRTTGDRFQADRMEQRLHAVEKYSADVSANFEMIHSYLKDLEATRRHAEPAGPEGMDLMEALIQHAEYQAALRVGGPVRSREIRGVVVTPHPDRSTIKHTLELSGLAVKKAYRSEIVEYDMGEHGLLDGIPRVVCTDPTYNVGREDADYAAGRAATTLAAAIDGAPTPKTTATFTSTKGLLPGTYVRILADSGVWKRELVVSFDSATNVVTFGSNELDFDAASGNAVIFEFVSFVAEGSTKLSGVFKDAYTEYTLGTIPLAFEVSKQALWSKAGLENILRRRLPIRMIDCLIVNLLYGPGTSGYCHGFMTETSRQTRVWSAMGDTAATKADTILRAINTQIAGNKVGVKIYMNSTEWDSIVRLKDTTGQYLMGLGGRIPIISTANERSIGGYPVVIEDHMYDADCLVMVPGQASEIAYNPAAEMLTVGYVNAQLLQNAVTMLYEVQMTHALLSFQKWVDITLDTKPT